MSSHLNGKLGCKKCYHKSKIITETEFIERVNNKYEKFYDYSKVVFINMTTKVTIICPEHGEFSQNAGGHLLCEYSCKLRVYEKRQIMSNEEFIIKANNKHNNKFDYRFVEIKLSKQPIIIICPKHGMTNQTPHYHLKSDFGCPKCGEDSFQVLESEFLQTALNKFNDKFDYSLMSYVNYSTDITIKCKIHGEFRQKPSTHIKSKHGCVKCANMFKGGIIEKRYLNKPTFLYYLKILHNGVDYYKFGLTINKTDDIISSVRHRYLKDIKQGMNYEIIYFKKFDNGHEAYLIEQKLKQITYEYNLKDNMNIIPSNIGYTELRKNDVLDILIKIIENK